jgi:hypothetical protein
MRPTFSSDRVFDHAKNLAVSSVLCLGRHTITGLLSTCGRQFVDWAADYRLFERGRCDWDEIFTPLRTAGISLLPDDQPIVAIMDDTLLRKRGKKVHGTAWRRDPLGPPFMTSLVWSQRVLQTSLAIPEQVPGVPGRARAVPIALHHCPTAHKPSSKASPEELDAYTTLRRTQRISVQGAAQLHQLRDHLNADPATISRKLVMCVDGGYTNKELYARPPENTTIIGRIRKDAKLYDPPTPEQRKKNGRTRLYGNRLPTPEQIRKDETIPWKTVRVFAAGQHFDVEIKSIGPVRWRPATGERDMRLVVIRPLAYRPSAGTRLLYRDPAYLLCSDMSSSDQQIVQWFLWRWEIEVNFRDEKTLLGVGEEQVRIPTAVEAVPQLKVAAYAALLLANEKVGQTADRLPLPLWRRPHPERLERTTTSQLIAHLRAALWGQALGIESFSGFGKNGRNAQKPKKVENSLPDAVLYAFG